LDACNTPGCSALLRGNAGSNGQTTHGAQLRRVSSTVCSWNRRRAAVLALALAACRDSAPPASAGVDVVAHGAFACSSDSLQPVTAAPAAGLWSGGAASTATRVAALIGPAATDVDRARITRRVETLELREGAASIRLATDTASVTLELVPRYAGRGVHADRAARAHTEAAAAYVLTPLVMLAAYEPCATNGEPRLRYLRRDARGGVATDLMLRRESAETTGALP
jgi:hypothetical protein